MSCRRPPERSGRSSAGLLVVALVATGAAPPPSDDRGFELLRYECRNEPGRREVTLFANGTIRLRDSIDAESRLLLDEMTRAELAPYVAQLRRILAEADAAAAADAPPAEGDWIERCEVAVALPDGPRRTWRFSALDAPPLAVSQLLHLAEELAGYVTPVIPEEHLPAAYRPETGDVLRTVEGYRYRVARRTADGRGVELDGIDQPLHLIVAIADLPEVFVAVEPDPGRR